MMRSKTNLDHSPPLPPTPVLPGLPPHANQKIYLSRLNVALGYTLVFISLLALTRSGNVGLQLFQILSEIVTKQGADIVYIFGTLVGIIVFFDTSIDEVFQGVKATGSAFNRLIPRQIFSGLKKDKQSLNRNKPITIKGGQNAKDEPMPAHAKAAQTPMQPVIHKREPELLPEKLVTICSPTPEVRSMGIPATLLTFR